MWWSRADRDTDTQELHQKVAASLGAARQLLEVDAARAAPAFAQCVQQAASAGSRELEADAELGWGEALFRLNGQERQALPHLERARQLGSGSVTEALAHLTEGDTWRFLRDGERAIRAYQHAATRFRSLSDVSGELIAQDALASFLEATGKAREAVPRFSRAAALAVMDHDRPKTAELFLRLGETLFKLDLKEQAATALAAAAAMYQQLGEARLEARARGLLFMMGKQQEFGRMVELLARHADDKGDAHLEGITNYMLARILTKQEGRNRGSGR